MNDKKEGIAESVEPLEVELNLAQDGLEDEYFPTLDTMAIVESDVSVNVQVQESDVALAGQQATTLTEEEAAKRELAQAWVPNYTTNNRGGQSQVKKKRYYCDMTK